MKQRVAVEAGRLVRGLPAEDEAPALLPAQTKEQRRHAIESFFALLDALPGAGPVRKDVGRIVSKEELAASLESERVVEKR